MQDMLVPVVILVGGGVVAYFRKIQKTNSDLCKKVERLQKTIIVLAKVIDSQIKHDHPDSTTELDELVQELLYEKE